MPRFTDMPITRKLTLILMFTCVGVLLFAGAALVGSEVIMSRSTIVADTETLSDILAENSTAALKFNDDADAARTLSSLRADPHIIAARLYTQDGNRLADYVRRDAVSAAPEHPGPDGHTFGSGRLAVFHPVFLNSKRVGTLYIEADLGKMYNRLALYATIVGAVLLCALAMTMALSRRLRRPISEPIIALARTARHIADMKDYSVRAARAGRDEIGALTDTFNQMLEVIESGQTSLEQVNRGLQAEIAERQKAEAQLNEYREHLEAMVAQRTQELAKANTELEQTVHAEHEARLEAQAAHETLRQTQARMVQAEKLAALGQLVAGVAHEINNPLAFVSNDVAVLTRDIGELRALLQMYISADPCIAEHSPDLAKRIHEHGEQMDSTYVMKNIGELLQRSRDGLNRIQQIVKDLRDFARQESIGDINEAADINAGVQSTVNIALGRAKKQQVDITLALGQVPPIACAPARINQVVLNLLMNAIDACKAGGAVNVATSAVNGGVEIRVSDNGCGIPPAIVGKIFDPFFTTKPPGQGTGLGLSISHGIVAEHGGEIEVQSEVNHGSCFIVKLPLKPPLLAAPAPRAASTPPGVAQQN